MQPYHAIDDGRWAEKRIGPERAGRPTRSARSSTPRRTLAFGSDWDVAPISPIAGIDAAVTRRTIDGKHPGGWIPEQKITVLRSAPGLHDAGGLAGFEEKEKGRCAPGSSPTSSCSRGPLRVPARQRDRGAQVDATVVGGKVSLPDP